MRAKFVGTDILNCDTDPIGIVRHGEYNISLERAGWWDRLFHGMQLMLWVQVAGKWFRLLYPDIKAFDSQWQLKNLINGNADFRHRFPQY
jgi:hypothetical protein